MRHLLVPTLLALAACNANPSAVRALEGTAPASAARVYTVDTAGATAEAALDGAQFTVQLSPGTDVFLFVEQTDGRVGALSFDDGHGGMTSRIPPFSGTIDLGAVTVTDLSQRARGASTLEVTSEHDPLAETDSDGDGESDLEDADDDGDGTGDADDADADGDGTDDHDEDLDSDDDGACDDADDDDDDDGTDDADDDDDGHDHDGDGSDCDDGEDGSDDDADDGDDGDGADDTGDDADGSDDGDSDDEADDTGDHGDGDDGSDDGDCGDAAP